MSFSFTGLFIFTLLLFIVFRFRHDPQKLSDIFIITSFITSIAVEVGYVFKIGSLSTGIGTFFMLVSVISYYYYLIITKKLFHFFFKKRLPLAIFSIFYFCIVSALFIKQNFVLPNEISLLSFGLIDKMYQLPKTFINQGINRWSIKAIAIFPFWCLYSLVVFERFRDKKFLQHTQKAIIYAVLATVSIQLIETIINYAHVFPNGFRDIVILLFGETTHVRIEPLNRFNMINAYALFKEPSHIAILYFIHYTVFLFSKNKSYVSIAATILTVPSVFVSGGTTPFLIMLVFLPIVLFQIFLGLSRKQKIISVLVFVLLLLVLSPVLYTITQEAVTKFLNYTGIKEYKPNIRMGQLFTSLKLFMLNPFFGIGINTYRCGMIMLTLLSNLGLIGTSLYFLYYLIQIKPVWSFTKIIFTVWTIFFWFFFLSIPFGAIYAPYFPFFFFFLLSDKTDKTMDASKNS